MQLQRHIDDVDVDDNDSISRSANLGKTTHLYFVHRGHFRQQIFFFLFFTFFFATLRTSTYRAAHYYCRCCCCYCVLLRCVVTLVSPSTLSCLEASNGFTLNSKQNSPKCMCVCVCWRVCVCVAWFNYSSLHFRLTFPCDFSLLLRY